jgi:hypothetical protein
LLFSRGNQTHSALLHGGFRDNRLIAIQVEVASRAGQRMGLMSRSVTGAPPRAVREEATGS